MKCTYHPEKDAVAECDACGKLFCGACLVEMGGKKYCRPCAAVQTGAGDGRAGDMAIAAVILSAASITLCGLTAIPGLILGIIELGRINRGQSPEKGRGMARAAVIIGAIMTGLLVLSILAAVAMTVIGIVVAILAG
jgi:hypothetical protein